MDDYTIEEKDKEVTGITVMYDDGSTEIWNHAGKNRKCYQIRRKCMQNPGKRFKNSRKCAGSSGKRYHTGEK